jgi:hypothetical protein
MVARIVIAGVDEDQSGAEKATEEQSFLSRNSGNFCRFIQFIDLLAIAFLDRLATKLQRWGKSSIAGAEFMRQEQDFFQLLITRESVVYLGDDTFVERIDIAMPNQVLS